MAHIMIADGFFAGCSTWNRGADAVRESARKFEGYSGLGHPVDCLAVSGVWATWQHGLVAGGSGC